MTWKIMLIDDEKDFTDMVKLNLEAAGNYTVRTHNNANTAYAAVREFRPDLIFLDVMMPGLDGGAVLDQLQSDEITKDIPVVFLTAIVQDEEKDAIGPTISGRPFLAKPVSTVGLIKCIKDNLYNEG